MEENKRPRKRLNIDIDPELRAEIKMRAASKQIPLRKWVIRALVEQIKREEQYEK